MDNFILSAFEHDESGVEIVERKGLGHPDTICDALAENLSRNLCREYIERCGTILHHNVDKALLTAGRSAPSFGGGTVLSPLTICLSGRATELGEGRSIQEIAIECSRSWLADHLRVLDLDKDVNFNCLIRPVSQDLRQLFTRQRSGAPLLANDTSIGVGYAPLSPLESLVLAVERRINGRDRNQIHPAWGEDVKVLAVRQNSKVDLTVACAMIGRRLSNLDDYIAEKHAVEELARAVAAEHSFRECNVTVNAADDLSAGAIYLTVTGTSAENGDDGEVGRGNRVNGLITPCRPMSLEAAAGKNPVTHVGKIYNVVAHRIANAIISAMPEIAGVECLMVSRIGAALTNPALLQIRLATHNGAPAMAFEKRARDIAFDNLNYIPRLLDDFIAGTVELF